MKRQPLSPEVEALWERPLPPAEFERRLREALADEASIDEGVALIAWFQRRYPTASERLAYVRRKYAEWTRRPVSLGPGAPAAPAGSPPPAGGDSS